LEWWIFDFPKEGDMNLRIEIILLLLLVVAVAAGVVGLSACLVRPQGAIASAELAIEGARSVGAERYATQTFETSLADYQAAMAEISKQDQRWLILRSYKEAEQLLASAQGAARESRSQASAIQKQIKTTRAAIDVAEMDLNSASRALDWNMDKIPRSEFESLESTLQELGEVLQKARGLLDGGHYEEAKAAAKSVMQKCNGITDQIRNVT
jgi:chromosome segregation ATPase